MRFVQIRAFIFLSVSILTLMTAHAGTLQTKPAQDKEWEALLRSLGLDSANSQSAVAYNKKPSPPALPASSPDFETPANPFDPFLAGALGLMPFASGLYLSDEPAKGIVFSAIDVLLALGVYTANHSSGGDPANTFTYFALMGLNNIVDSYFSAHEAMKRHPPTAQVTILPYGGVQYAIHLTF